MNLFIDTNIFLAFYHLSSDDLEELKKLAGLVRQGKVDLFLPEQVVVEFQRNRASKIADALKRLQEQRLNFQFPQFCREYDEYEQLRRCLKECEDYFTRLLENIDRDVKGRNLKADATVNELFGIATGIPSSDQIISRAQFRHDIRNPPGKNDSLGDAINWEALLETTPEGEEIYFVSDDKDYCSPLDASQFDPFLLDEWAARKGSQLFFFKRLSSFLKEKFPYIKLASELEKDLLIRELAESGSFANTHVVFAKLSRYSDFNTDQINELVSAAITNSQVNWIAQDTDVSEFYCNLVRGREDRIDQENLRHLKRLIPQIGTEEELDF
jgi:predicted nucleic acid-binding protein